VNNDGTREGDASDAKKSGDFLR